MSAAATELIVRAVIRSNDALLVARERGKSYVFLPGGHVEPGEPVEDALARELKEELGASAGIGELLYVVEQGYADDSGSLRHELNLVFTAHITGAFESREEHLEFLWLPMDQLSITDLRPAALREVLGDRHTNLVWCRWTP